MDRNIISKIFYILTFINLTHLHTITIGIQQPRGVTMTRTITHKHLNG